MADNGNDNGSTKPKSVDLSKLKTSANFGKPSSADLYGLTEASKVAAKIQEQIALPKSMMDSLTSISAAHMPNSALSRATKMITEQNSAIAALQKSMLGSDISGALGAAVSDDKIVDIRTPTFPEIDSPPNPILETNQRLKSIESQFEKMQGIALKGAEIATELQTFAAEFLGKFEAAAHENTRAAKRAIWLGVFAVIFAFAMPAIQIAYSELWRGPQEAVATQEVITELKAEVAAMVEGQALITERLIEALALSDRDTTAALLEIGNILAQSNSIPQVEAAIEN